MAAGYFDEDEENDPLIQIGLTGAADHPIQPIVCLIDTGFDGFLLLPEADAPTFKLITKHTLPVVYANRTTAPRPLCVGFAEIGGVRKQSLVTLEANASHTLLGIMFPRVFELRLLVDVPNRIIELATAPPPAQRIVGAPGGPQPLGPKRRP